MSDSNARLRRASTALVGTKRAVLACLVAAALGAQGRAVESQDWPRVAIADFNGFMQDQDGRVVNLGPVVTDMLITEFSGREGLTVLERSELKFLLDEMDLQLSGRMNNSGAVAVGQLIGVQYVLLGQVSSIANVLRMDIRAVDVETSVIVSVLRRLGPPTTALFTEIVSFADEFGEQLDLDPPTDRPSMESIPVRATIEYSRGLDFEDRGEVELAVERYEAALQIYPELSAAQRALERLRTGG